MAVRTRNEASGKWQGPGSSAGREMGAAEPFLRPGQCREYMRRTLAREFRGIVQGFVEGAKTGSCQHVKLATELMEPARKVRARGKGTVQQLLEELEREGK